MEGNEGNDQSRPEPKRMPVPLVAVLGLVAIALFVTLYGRFFTACLTAWRAEGSYYSHGFLVPVISAWLLWSKRKALARVEVRPCAKGLILVGAALAVQLFSDYIYLQTGVGLAVVLMLMGLVWIFFGREMFRKTAVPIGFLLLAVPLSPIFTEPVSFPLRVFSTKLGVGMLQAAGVAVQAEGTFIQFPHFRLVVPNACSGMQSLLALVAALCMFVYIVRGVWWKKAILLACIIPSVVVANASRLALTALLAVGVHQKTAEGAVHELTGVMVFVVAMGLLLFVGKTLLGLSELAVDDDEENGPEDGQTPPGGVAQALRTGLAIKPLAGVGLVAMMLLGVWGTRALAPLPPGVASAAVVLPNLSSVPLTVGEWEGNETPMTDELLEALGVDVAVERTYKRPDEMTVRLVAEARVGKSRDQFHLPTVCLTGQGWSVLDDGEDQVHPEGFDEPIETMWMVVTKEHATMLVRYWLWDGEGYIKAPSEIWRTLNAVAAWERLGNPNPKGALFIMYTPITALGGEQAAIDAQRDLAEELLPSIDEVLNTIPSSGSADGGASELE